MSDDDGPGDADHSGPAAEPDPVREPDPDTDRSDPATELPNVPTVDAPATDPAAAPDELVVGFWTTVALLNVAVLAVAVGVLLLAFGVERLLGAGLLVVGALSLLRGYRRYRVLDERHRSGALTAPAGDEPEDGSGGPAAEDGGGKRESEGGGGEPEGEDGGGEPEGVPSAKGPNEGDDRSATREERNG